MKDRLEHMKSIGEDLDDCDLNEPDLRDPDPDVVRVDICQEDVVFDSSSMDSVLGEAHSIRQEIFLLQEEVELLVQHNEQVSTAVNDLTALKQDSNSIAQRIQKRGEALYTRLQHLGQLSQQLEEKEGPHAAVSRIARSQHATLTRAFHATVSEYNLAEENQKEVCRARLQRQASILGKKVTGEQLDQLVERGGEGWVELSQSLQTDGRSSNYALSEIKGRHEELIDLEARLTEVRDLFLQMAMLVEEQGCQINSIEANVCGTEEYIARVNVHIKKALEYKSKNCCWQFCSCFSRWRRPP